MIIRIYDYNGKGKLVKIPDDCEYIEFDILNGDMVLTYPIQVDACDEPRKWMENEGHYKLTKDKFNKLWHLKRDVLTFQRVICLARNRTFREEDYSPLLNLFLKWQKTI